MTLSEEVWHPDTGASNYMISDSGVVFKSTPYLGTDKIFVGKGLLSITHKGETTLSTPKSFNLKNVRIVPAIKRNLLSIRKFYHDNNSSFEFDFVVSV